ncbi:hypothetical protein U1Q18_003327 [Sarracenia purpurea var. burkii]
MNTGRNKIIQVKTIEASRASEYCGFLDKLSTVLTSGKNLGSGATKSAIVRAIGASRGALPRATNHYGSAIQPTVFRAARPTVQQWDFGLYFGVAVLGFELGFRYFGLVFGPTKLSDSRKGSPSFAGVHQGDLSRGATSKAFEEGEVEGTVLGRYNRSYGDDKSKSEMDPKVSVEVKHQGDSSGGATSKALEEGEVEETVLGKVEENQGYVDDKSKYEIDTGKAMMKMVSSSGELDAIYRSYVERKHFC